MVKALVYGTTLKKVFILYRHPESDFCLWLQSLIYIHHILNNRDWQPIIHAFWLYLYPTNSQNLYAIAYGLHSQIWMSQHVLLTSTSSLPWYQIENMPMFCWLEVTIFSIRMKNIYSYFKVVTYNNEINIIMYPEKWIRTYRYKHTSC